MQASIVYAHCTYTGCVRGVRSSRLHGHDRAIRVRTEIFSCEGYRCLLAAISFLRIAFAEPTTSVLLVNHRTRTLAMLSLSTVIGLLVTAVLALLYRSLYAVVLGKVIGDIVMFGITMTILQRYIGDLGWRPFIRSCWAVGWIVAAIIFSVFSPLPETSLLHLGLLTVLAMIGIGGLAIDLRPMIVRAYSRSP